ncbi:MAG: hypothetical protein GX597_07300 [Anaerolineaceae bacterium]|nr:hypothetical protein [Anaerolineaceae bacterium]
MPRLCLDDIDIAAAIPGAAVTLGDNLGITYTFSSDLASAYALEAWPASTRRRSARLVTGWVW